jgi:hypothetical protein
MLTDILFNKVRTIVKKRFYLGSSHVPFTKVQEQENRR